MPTNDPLPGSMEDWNTGTFDRGVKKLHSAGVDQLPGNDRDGLLSTRISNDHATAQTNSRRS